MTRDECAKLHAPRVPPETCPIAESLQATLGGLSADIGLFREEIEDSKRKTWPCEEVEERLVYFEQLLAGLRLRIEELRLANEQLRESGRYWRGAAKGANEQLDALLSAVAPYRHRLPPEVDRLVGRVLEAA